MDVWYRERPADRDLTDHLACVWHADVGGELRTLVPDACMDLLWVDGTIWLCGPETSSWTFAYPEGTMAVGVRFRPAVASAALRLDASEVRNMRVRADDLWGDRTARRLNERLNDAAAADQRLAILADVVRQRLAEACPVDPVASEVVERLSGRHPQPVNALARQLGISERQLHRRATAAFGYAPTVLARILRVQRFLAMARAAGRPTGLAELAIACGFSDQPHLTREVKAIAGTTPGAVLRS